MYIQFLLKKLFRYYHQSKNENYTKPTQNAPNKDHQYTYVGERAVEELTAAEGEGINLTISGILRLKSGLTYGCLTSGLNLTESLVHTYIGNTMQNDSFLKWIREESFIELENPLTGQPVTVDGEPVRVYLSPAENLDEYYDIESELSFLMGSEGGAIFEMLRALLTQFNASFAPETVIRLIGGDNTVTSIALYARDFDGKTAMIDYLDAWNDMHEEDPSVQITYTDTVGLLMGMVQQILDIITYVLVAFTSISLVVSSVMIGIITYVSVVERIKEIGVLRSLGARKQDIRNLFNAETFIIGLAAGIIGVAFSYIISLFINIIIQSLTGIAGIAALPFATALVMVLVSVVLTLISGLIPAQSAANKDPVIALRTE